MNTKVSEALISDNDYCSIKNDNDTCIKREKSERKGEEGEEVRDEDREREGTVDWIIEAQSLKRDKGEEQREEEEGR